MTDDANAPAQERNVVRFHSLDVPLCCDSGTRRWGKPHPTGRPMQVCQTKPIWAGKATTIADWGLRIGDSRRQRRKMRGQRVSNEANCCVSRLRMGVAGKAKPICAARAGAIADWGFAGWEYDKRSQFCRGWMVRGVKRSQLAGHRCDKRSQFPCARRQAGLGAAARVCSDCGENGANFAHILAAPLHLYVNADISSPVKSVGLR